MYRTIFLQPTEGFGSHLISHDSVPMPRGTLSSTFIFSSIGDALSRAYDSVKETVGDVTDSVSETVSNAYDATVETVSNVADTVAETASSAYSSTVETLSDAADTVSETVSDGYDATRNYVEGVASGEKEINYWTARRRRDRSRRCCCRAFYRGWLTGRGRNIARFTGWSRHSRRRSERRCRRRRGRSETRR